MSIADLQREIQKQELRDILAAGGVVLAEWHSDMAVGSVFSADRLRALGFVEAAHGACNHYGIPYVYVRGYGQFTHPSVVPCTPSTEPHPPA